MAIMSRSEDEWTNSIFEQTIMEDRNFYDQHNRLKKNIFIPLGIFAIPTVLIDQYLISKNSSYKSPGSHNALLVTVLAVTLAIISKILTNSRPTIRNLSQNGVWYTNGCHVISLASMVCGVASLYMSIKIVVSRIF